MSKTISWYSSESTSDFRSSSFSYDCARLAETGCGLIASFLIGFADFLFLNNMSVRNVSPFSPSVTVWGLLAFFFPDSTDTASSSSYWLFCISWIFLVWIFLVILASCMSSFLILFISLSLFESSIVIFYPRSILSRAASTFGAIGSYSI